VSVTNLRDNARQIFFSALQAVDARAATRRTVSLNDSLLKIGETEIEIAARPIYVVAIGKAAGTMAAGLTDVLGNRITRGIICGPAQESIQLHGWQTFVGGHPLPTQPSLIAARAALQLLTYAEAGALILFLISGGGSAMFELPVDKINLFDLREANRQLVSCGARIAEMNSVRRGFSAVKGGKLALTAPNTDQITLIVSDTNVGEASCVASGPSIEPDAKATPASEVVKRYGLENSLPKSILEAIGRYADVSRASTHHLRAHYVLLDNRTALEGADLEARKLGFIVEVARDINEQEIDAGCDLLISRAQALWNRHGGKPVCLLSGGEFSCRVSGDGVGGRNLETVMRCAMKLDSLPREDSSPNWVVLSAGTDGIDGNSEAAGAVADQTTLSRAAAKGVSPESYLSRSDSFHFFEHLGDVIVTGPTGTNVRDVRIVLTGS
jgi:hydroxypyruvate reductase